MGNFFSFGFFFHKSFRIVMISSYFFGFVNTCEMLIVVFMFFCFAFLKFFLITFDVI